MPLSAEKLGTELFALLEVELAVSKEGNLKLLADAIAKAVVTHITTNADVTGTCPTSGGPLTLGKVL